jgi:hypothetical protein
MRHVGDGGRTDQSEPGGEDAQSGGLRLNQADDPHVNKWDHAAIHRSTDVDNRLRLSFFRRDPSLMTSPYLSKGSNGLLKTVDVLYWLSIFFDCKRKKGTAQKAHLGNVLTSACAGIIITFVA